MKKMLFLLSAVQLLLSSHLSADARNAIAQTERQKMIEARRSPQAWQDYLNQLNAPTQPQTPPQAPTVVPTSPSAQYDMSLASALVFMQGNQDAIDRFTDFIVNQDVASIQKNAPAQFLIREPTEDEINTIKSLLDWMALRNKITALDARSQNQIKLALQGGQDQTVISLVAQKANVTLTQDQVNLLRKMNSLMAPLGGSASSAQQTVQNPTTLKSVYDYITDLKGSGKASNLREVLQQAEEHLNIPSQSQLSDGEVQLLKDAFVAYLSMQGEQTQSQALYSMSLGSVFARLMNTSSKQKAEFQDFIETNTAADIIAQVPGKYGVRAPTADEVSAMKNWFVFQPIQKAIQNLNDQQRDDLFNYATDPQNKDESVAVYYEKLTGSSLSASDVIVLRKASFIGKQIKR